jgi:hypothetical protein
MLAEAAAQGMEPEEIVRHCRAAVTAFALPDCAGDGAEEA